MGIIRHTMKPIYAILPFGPNGSEPIDSLMQLPSGWDVSLPRYIMSEMHPPSNRTLIIDPFVGAGATLLAAKEIGCVSLGADVEPLAAVASFAKTERPNNDDISHAADSLDRLICENLASAPAEIQALNSFWSECAVLAVLANWWMRALPAGSPERRASIKRLRSMGPRFKGEGMSKILLTDCRSPHLWQLAAHIDDITDWLVVTSPPFTNSRGNSLHSPLWMRDLASSLATIITQCSMGLDRTPWLRGPSRHFGEVVGPADMLEQVAAHCPGRASVIAEYETVNDDWSWMEAAVAKTSTGSWETLELFPFYGDAPDHRPGVTEGGLVLARR